MKIIETKMAIGRLIVGVIEWDECRVHSEKDHQLEKRLHMDAVEIKRLAGYKSVADLDSIFAFIEREIGPTMEKDETDLRLERMIEQSKC